MEFTTPLVMNRTSHVLIRCLNLNQFPYILVYCILFSQVILSFQHARQGVLELPSI